MNHYEEKRRSEANRAWLNSLIADAFSRSWYGTLTVKIEAGRIVRVEKNESMLPPPVDKPSG